jgi:hypothetical protein
MLVPHHCDSRQGVAPLLALPVTSYDERTVGIALAAHAHAAGVRFQDAGLEMRFNSPGVQGFFESFEGREFLSEVQRWHCFGYEGRLVGVCWGGGSLGYCGEVDVGSVEVKDVAR